MDRYSFFIVNSFLGGYSVSAVGKLSDNLPIRGKQYLAINSDIVSDSENLIPSDNVGTQSEENQTSENNPENWEETGNESQLTQYEQDLLDSFGGYGDYEEYYQNEVPSRVTRRDFVGGGGSSGGGGASLDSTKDRLNRLERWVSSHDTWAGNLSRRVDSVSSFANGLLGRIQNLESIVNAHTNYWNEQWTKNRNNANYWNEQWAFTRGQKDYNFNNSNYWSEQWTKNRNNGNYWNEQWAFNTSQKTYNANNSGYWSEMWAFRNGQKDYNTNNSKYWSEQWAKNKTNSGYWNEQWVINRSQKEYNENNAGYWSEQWDKNRINSGYWSEQWDKNKTNSGYWSEQWNRNTKQDKTNTTFSDFMIAQNLKNVDFQKQIDNLSFNWSDVGIITALGLVKDSIDNFKEMFSVNELVGLNAHEGIFTRMIKSQFISLKNEINSIFKYEESGSKGSYWTGLSKILRDELGRFGKYLDTYFDINNKESSLYKIRYSIVSGFMDLEEVVKLIRGDTLALRDSLNTVNLNLTAVNSWLKSIFEKPVGTVVSPPFDFDRLEQILKKLSLGEIVNEAGTNFWDFMKSLIDNLGEIIGKGIDGLVSLLQKIFDILDGLIDTILGLVIPKNWDFLDKGFGSLKGKFDVKFKVFLDLGGLVKNLFTPTSQDFLKAISFTWLGVNFDFTQSQSSLDIYVPKFRLAISVFIWAITAIYIYRKITGTGDVINDS